jgi:hypothetical protein
MALTVDSAVALEVLDRIAAAIGADLVRSVALA